MSSTTTDTVTMGDVALVTFWARAIAASDESGEAMIGVVFERRVDPYTKSLNTAISLAQGGAWKRHFFPFSLIESYGTGGAHVNVLVGYKPQTVQVGGLRVINYKKTKQLSDLPKTPTTWAEKLWKILDRFGALNLTIESTEFDIKSADRDYQAAYLKDFMTALFAHPSLNGIVMWGFWAKSHWIPSAALFDSSWTIRPHGQAWIDLVTKDWWTNANGVTGAGGSYSTRGFLGDYEVTASLGIVSRTVPCTLIGTGTTVDVVFDATPELERGFLDGRSNARRGGCLGRAHGTGRERSITASAELGRTADPSQSSLISTP